MPTSVRLDTESETLLKRLARESGCTKSEVIREALRHYAEGRAGPPAGETVYDRLKPWIGIVKEPLPYAAADRKKVVRELIARKHRRK